MIWTAEPGHEITAGQLQAFQLSVGPVPDTDSIALPAVQTYTDGSVVNWSESGEARSILRRFSPWVTRPPHPATDPRRLRSWRSPHPAGSDTEDVLARGLGLGGLVLGAIALVLAIAKRRTAES